jgi:hypothetical protein
MLVPPTEPHNEPLRPSSRAQPRCRTAGTLIQFCAPQAPSPQSEARPHAQDCARPCGGSRAKCGPAARPQDRRGAKRAESSRISQQFTVACEFSPGRPNCQQFSGSLLFQLRPLAPVVRSWARLSASECRIHPPACKPGKPSFASSRSHQAAITISAPFFCGFLGHKIQRYAAANTTSAWREHGSKHDSCQRVTGTYPAP